MHRSIVQVPSHALCHIFAMSLIYYINITLPERVIVKNIILRNMIINRGAAEVDNHISRDDIFNYHPLRECYIYFIIPNKTSNPWALGHSPENDCL